MDWKLSDGKNALEHMRKRASCRSFSDKEIPSDLLRDIIDTGLCAASGGNLQPISIIVLKEQKEKDKICEVCGGQKFMAQASVNLLFLLDWHKMGLFAEREQALYKCPSSFMHFLIGLEDVICAAQTIESAAWLSGVGSCYVGTTNHVGAELIKMYNLPKHTYPVVLLSLGYPKADLTIAPKLAYNAMVFDGRYPDLTVPENKDAIIRSYEEKYKGRVMQLPSNEDYKEKTLEAFKNALLTTYSPEETEKIISDAISAGQINETQRRFGLHYHAADMIWDGKNIMKMMEDNGLGYFKK